MKKNILPILLSLVMAFVIVANIRANDGVYFTMGNFLVPVNETDVAVDKEVLTITIGKDNFATVDVYYEFLNGGEQKNMIMAFEASAPYNDLSPISRSGVHPYIKDFTVCMNGTVLPYRNAVVACKNIDGSHTVDFTPLDLNKWKGYGEVPDSVLPENDAVYNSELDSVVSFSYAYYFNAPFKPGKNVVHHTYRYRMGYTVVEDFVIPYWLTPAMRWANRQVNDFTLRIASDAPTEFCLVDTLFSSAPFETVRNNKIYRFSDEYDNSLVYAKLMPGDTVVWHGKPFKPSANIFISSPSWKQNKMKQKWQTSEKVVLTADNRKYRLVGRDADNYYVESGEVKPVPKKGSRDVKYSAVAGQGLLCVDGSVVKCLNVRRRPSVKSRVVSVIDAGHEDNPARYQCLGLVDSYDKGDEYDQWYKIKVGNKTGYVKAMFMLWSPF